MTILLRFFKGGLTQEQAARLLGVSQVQVSRLERRALEKLRASSFRSGFEVAFVLKLRHHAPVALGHVRHAKFFILRASMATVS